MQGGILLGFVIFLLLTLPFASAQMTQPQHSPFDLIGQVTSNIWHEVKMVFYNVQKFFYDYILHNENAVGSVTKTMEKEVAYNAYYNHEYHGCCRDASCYIYPERQCVTLCVPCEKTKQELDRYFQ